MRPPQKYMPLLIAFAGLFVLPFVLLTVGLTLTTATDVVIFAILILVLLLRPTGLLGREGYR